jgi:hypothetical protein
VYVFVVGIYNSPADDNYKPRSAKGMDGRRYDGGQA